MKKNIIIFYLVLSAIIIQTIDASSATIEGVLCTFNLPSPLGQPGYQLIIPPLNTTATFLDVNQSYSWQSTNTANPSIPYLQWWSSSKYAGIFYGLNPNFTQGYFSPCVLSSGNPLIIQRPNLSNISKSINSLFSWPDFLTIARAFYRNFYVSYTSLSNNIYKGSFGFYNGMGTFNYINGGINYLPQSLNEFAKNILIEGFALNGQSACYLYTYGNLNLANAKEFDPIPFASNLIWQLGSQDTNVDYTGKNISKNNILNRSGGTVNQMPFLGANQSNIGEFHFGPYSTENGQYVFPFYTSYYANPASNTSLCYFTNKTFQNLAAIYSQSLQELSQAFFKNGSVAGYYWNPSCLTNLPQTTVSVSNFIQTLPGFGSQDTIGNLFMNVFISGDTNTQSNFTNANINLSSYSLSNTVAINIAGGLFIYLPLFLNDPATPYVPAGWNFATPSTIYDAKNKALMTDFSQQINFESNCVYLGI